MVDPPECEPVLTVVVEDEVTITRLVLQGDLDLEGADVLTTAVAQLDGGPLEIDLAGIDFIDSSGIRVLIILRKERGAHVVAPSAAVLRTFELASVDFLLTDPVLPTA